LQKYNTQIQELNLIAETATKLLIKREDSCPSGSFKDRLVADVWPRISTDNQEVVVHSSGNFAISCLHHAELDNSGIKLVVFINDNLPKQKLDYLETLAAKANSRIIKSARPKSDAIKYANEHGSFLFRGSTDSEYPNSYFSLAEEIVESGNKIDVVIIPTSSATAAVGVMRYLVAKQLKVPVFIVQTSHINSIASEFDHDFSIEESSPANAIADRIAKRRGECLELINQLQGGGIVVNNQQLLEATTLINSSEFSSQGLIPQSPYTSFTANAALSFAGFFKLQAKGYNFKNPLLILSGN
jgi:threonine dehydratase